MSTRSELSVMTKASAAALHFLVTDADPVIGPDFWNHIISGAHAREDDAAWVFREHLRRTAAERADRPRRRADQKALLCLGLAAWNLWCTSTPAPRRTARGVDDGVPYLPWTVHEGVPPINRQATREPSGTEQLILARP